MRSEKFDTTEPIELNLELHIGEIEIIATETDATIVEIEGKHADDVHIEHKGRTLDVIGPKPHGFSVGREWALAVRITLPEHSDVTVKSSSAPITQRGALRHIHGKTGSGAIALDRVEQSALADTGSGSVTLAAGTGDIRLRTGSGDVSVGAVHGETIISTGSGDVSVKQYEGDITFKTGSGDALIGSGRGKVRVRSGSGDVRIDHITAGEVDAKTGSGGVFVRVPIGTPVWTDVAARRFHSSLPSTGEPEPGQDHVKLTARTGSGKVELAPAG